MIPQYVLLTLLTAFKSGQKHRILSNCSTVWVVKSEDACNTQLLTPLVVSYH